tara:strand:+ start:386 stop:751 length:366 start_codon:yes stop_codon:yes gene_type:complete
MTHDFRHYSFNSLFSLNSYEDKIVLLDNDLSENQLLRAQQLILFFNENATNIIQIIEKLSDNWSFERIAKPEKTALLLGIAELKMRLTPRKVIISEWVKLVDKHSSSEGAKFVNAVLDNYE